MTKWAIKGFAIVLFFLFTFITVQFFNFAELKYLIESMLKNPFWLLLMTAAYFLAFYLRAWAWKWYLSKKIPISILLYGLFYSLLVNHILPIKAGDAVRMGILKTQKHLSWDETIHSVVMMRSLDLLSLGFLAMFGALFLGYQISVSFFLIILILIPFSGGLLYWAASYFKFGFIQKHLTLIFQALRGRNGVLIVSFVLGSWLLEGMVVIGVCYATGFSIGVIEGIWVNSITIVGQIFHFTPGGIGSYESIMSFLLHSQGLSLQNAYHIALVSHLYKFIFSYLVGFIVWLKYPITIKQIKAWLSKEETQP